MNSKTFGALRLATRNSALLMAAWIVSLGWFAPRVSGEVLVGDVFVTGFEGWTDTYVGPARIGSPPNWGILLVDHWLSESSDGREGDDLSAEAANSGLYTPYLMVNMADVTPATYDLTATMSTHDNDGFGIVFGYEDNNNYFRIGMRDQSSGNLGFPVGLSVQKVVNGTITQIGWDGGAFLPYTDGTPFEVVLNVDNSDWMVTIDDLYFLAGSDSNLQGGHYGVHSWAQKQVNTAEAGGSLQRGTVLQSISVSSTTLNKTTDFGDAIPVAWRALQMVNSVGAIGNGGEDLGNFRQDFRNGTIQDDTNGYEWATSGTPNIDFIGPAVVINEPGSAAWTNYQMKVRMENGDNDGIGLLVRVADDSTFYRINFSREGMGTTASRAPQGLSIQKCDMGSWSELFRDDQAAPKFIYTEDQPFDVIVSVVEDVIQVKVIDDPDGAATVYSYDPVVDNSFSISQGSVGFTNWGSGDATNGIIFSPFGGDSDVLLETISDIVDIQATVDRTTGNVTLENVGFNDVDIHAYSIFSPAGALSLGGWNPITDHYDEPPPGDGSVDSNDPWTIVTETENELTEAELSGGDGGTFALNTPVDLGEVWVKSRIEDLIIELELTSGSIVQLPVIYEGDRYSRSDLNTDGSITAADWLLFHPNTLADLSSFFVVDQALAGDLDGDGDNDVDDFTLFKADFEAANGAGSFEAMLASIPEPSSLILLVLGFLGAAGIQRWARSIGRRAALMVGFLAMVLLPGMASAVDFTTFTVDNYPEITAGWPQAIWDATPTTATNNSNAGPNVFYGTQDILNSRIFGTLVAGTDDDIVGMVFGYKPSDTSNASADFILLDWKGATQSYDFLDPAGMGPFHDLTGTTNSIGGLALSRVTGIPTADELWGHVDLEGNPGGGVEELARAATLGSSRYPGNNPVYFDIRYTSTAITVYVNDVEEFNLSGTFGSGRLGLYTHSQGPSPIFSNFDIIPLDQVLSATVDTTTGEIVLTNKSAFDVQFDFYQFDSAGNSLNPFGWSSLDSKNYDATGSNPGQSWDEAGGSNESALAEMYLQGSTILSGSESVSLGNAYDTSVDAQDLALKFRLLPYGYILDGSIEYIASPTQGGDFDEDGDVDGNDFLAWQRGFGMTTGATHGDGDANNDGAVTSADLDIWKSQFGSGGAGAGAGVNAIPEPSTFWLIALVLTGLFCQRMARRP